MSAPHTCTNTAQPGGHATVAAGPDGPVLTVTDPDGAAVATRALDRPRGRRAVEPRLQQQAYEAVLAELGYARTGAWATTTGWDVWCPVQSATA